MTILWHELKRGRTSLLVWSLAIGGMIVACMLMFPEMKKQVDEMDAVFSSLGSFTAAFGLDRVSLGDPMGFYGIEGGNILGLGGGFFAALLGISALANEEKNRTAEFLLTHPISRTQIVFEKWLAIVAQLILLNTIIIIFAMSSFWVINESISWQSFWLLHSAFFIMQLEIACICFALSAFIARGGLGIGLGLTGFFYFISLLANLTEQASFLRYFSPFSYAEAASIIAETSIDLELLVLAGAVMLFTTAITFWQYNRKDIVG